MFLCAAQMCCDVYNEKENEGVVRVSKKNAVADIKHLDGCMTIIAFRGTDDLYDWYSNLRLFRKVLTPSTFVHGGFFNEEQNIRESVIAELRPESSYIICGHSLGGCMATLFAAHVREMTHKQVFVYTFGCPNVGNDLFCRQIDDHIEVINTSISNDLICHLPLSYQKPGRIIKLRSPKPWYWLRTNHSMKSYRDVILDENTDILFL
jgi:predicted lipase